MLTFIVVAIALTVVLAPLIGLLRVGARAASGWLIAWTVPIALLAVAGVTMLLFVDYLAPQTGTLPATTAKSKAEFLEELAKIAAFAASALFLMIKVAAGYGYSNAKLTTSIARKALDASKDSIVVTTRIESVGARSFQLLDLKMLPLNRESGKPLGESLLVSGFSKTSVQASRLNTEEFDGPLTLNPGDSIEVAGWTEVNKDAILPLKIVVLGFASTALTTEQWTSAVVSVPDSSLRKKAYDPETK